MRRSNQLRCLNLLMLVLLVPSLNAKPIITSPLTGATLPDGIEGVAYSSLLCTVDNGLQTLWSATLFWSGTGLPAGMSIDVWTGAIAGTPAPGTAGKTYDATIIVKDFQSQNQEESDPVNVTIFVHLPAQLTSSGSLGMAMTGTPFSTAIAAANGYITPSGGYTYSIASGELPPGLTLDALTGELSGVPTASGAYSFDITVEDEYQPPSSDTESFTIEIYDPPQIMNTGALPLAQINTFYTVTLQASDGMAPFVWTIAGLPGGLMASNDGTISGTPNDNTIGFYVIDVSLTDSGVPPAEANTVLALTVVPEGSDPLTITTTSLSPAQEGVNYTLTLAAAGGTQPYQWNAVGLPTGLALDGDSIAGIPSSVSNGIYFVGIDVTDAAGTQTSTIIALSVVENIVAPITAADAASSPLKNINLVGGAGCSLERSGTRIEWLLLLFAVATIAGRHLRPLNSGRTL